MDIMYEQLTQEEAVLGQQIAFLKDKRKSWPSGSLEISHSKGAVQYYYIQKNQDGRPERKYIRKQNTALAESLAQRDYEKKLLVELEKRYEAIGKARKIYDSKQFG